MTHIINGSEIVREHTLEKLKTEAGDPATLDNLNLKITQQSPVCGIEIQIGPGRITSVSVEAEDHTWAIGRHTELMEKLVKTRAKWASGSRFIPQWPKRQPVTLGRASLAFGKYVVGVIAAIFFAFVVIIILSLAIEPPSIAVTSLYHHAAIRHGTIVRLPFSAACIAIIVATAFIASTESKSKVIIQDKSFWTSSRTAMIASIAAVVSAFVGVIALFIR